MKFKLLCALTLFGFHPVILAVKAGEESVTGEQRVGGLNAPTPEPNGFDKVRFISFVAPTGGGNSALRINLTSLHHVNPPYTNGPTVAFTTFEGQSVWVGPPSNYNESSSFPVQFKASFARCQPHYQDWSTVGLLHVTGSATPPSSIFHVENVDGVCQGVENTVDCQSGGINVSSQLEVRTSRWGDVDLPFNPPPGSRQPDVGDTAALIKKFRNAQGSVIKARALIAAQDAFGVINTSTITNDLGFSPIAAVVDAFRGNPYPYKMGKCTGNPTGGTGACTSNSECTGNNGAGPCILDNVGTCSGSPNSPCRWSSQCDGAGLCVINCP